MKFANLILASAFVLSTGAFAEEVAPKATGNEEAAATKTVEKTEKTTEKKAVKKAEKKSHHGKKAEAPKAE